MIELVNLSKTFHTNGRHTTVANNITATFPPRKCVGILGRNGAGKSSMLRMISGAMDPDDGHINITGTVSWPVGFAGSFHPELTGLQNTRFIARVYGIDTEELADFVEGFAGLGQHFRLPLRNYSSGMRSRLAFGVSMGIKFDTYLMDEVVAVGDEAFKKSSDQLLKKRLSTSGAIYITHSMPQIKRLCDHAAVLDRGNLHYYTDVNHAIQHHQDLMAQQVSALKKKA